MYNVLACGSHPRQNRITEGQLRHGSKTIHICNHLPRGIFLGNHRQNEERICNKRLGEVSILKREQMLLFSLSPTAAKLENTFKILHSYRIEKPHVFNSGIISGDSTRSLIFIRTTAGCSH